MMMENKTITSRNPATEELLAGFDEYSDSLIERKLDASANSFRDWSRQPLAERAALIRDVARELRSHSAGLAELITLEMGKPLNQSAAEVEKCAACCEFYADRGPEFLMSRNVPTEATRSYVRYDPIGPVLAVMPWNFPFWQVFRFAAPALLAGNTALLKHASNVSLCSLRIEEIFRDAGLPSGVFQSLLKSGRAVETMIAHPAIRAVTLTGSEHSGKIVAAAAGRAIKKSVLELGGSDPFLVLEGADIAKAARVALRARIINSGQSCIAAKRFLVVRRHLMDFTDAFLAEVKNLRMGDPRDQGIDLGPIARHDLRDELNEQVQKARSEGARLLAGGAIPPGIGYYYPMTVLSADRGTTIARDETFGPVAPIIAVADEAEAIRVANDSPFGLGASVWTEDLDRAARIAGELDVGCVFVNELVKSDPRLPFGGVKMSGYGRELSEEGIREFTNIKSVYIAADGKKA